MRLAIGSFIACAAICLGCTKTDVAPTTSNASASGSDTVAAAEDDSASTEGSTSSSTAGDFEFGPENAQIGFVGTHVADDPKPRTGGFEKFVGTAKLDADGKIAAVTVDIQTDSLWTQHAPLTAHLNSPDFLDTREYPTANFASTEIKPGEADGEVTITGKLTMHGVTKEITFPAKVAITHDKPTLHAEFPLKRTDFGMDKKLEGVHDEVAMTIVIGEKTEKLPETAP